MHQCLCKLLSEKISRNAGWLLEHNPNRKSAKNPAVDSQIFLVFLNSTYVAHARPPPYLGFSCPLFGGKFDSFNSVLPGGFHIEARIVMAYAEFVGLLARLRAGSADAATELVRRYGRHIRRVVCRRFNVRIRSKFGFSDLIQDVWASFFALPPDKYDFECPADLVRFLSRLAHNKVIAAIRQRLRTQKYDVRKECPLEDACRQHADAFVVRTPAPDEQTSVREEWQRLLEGQPERYRQVLAALRDGETHAEISRQLGMNERTVRRVLHKLSATALTSSCTRLGTV